MRFAFVFVILIAAAIANAQSASNEKDNQLWHDTQLTIPLVKTADGKADRLSLILTGTLRAGRNFSAMVDERVAIGLEYRVNRHLSIMPSYLYRADQLTRGRTFYESRIRLDVQLEKKFKNFTIRDRNRVEHRLRNSRSDLTRYRNKFQFIVPVKKNGKEIFAPFAATEPVYEFQSKHWTRNEFSLGIQKKFSPTFAADFFYLLQNNRGPVLKHVNVLGITLKFRIDR